MMIKFTVAVVLLLLSSGAAFAQANPVGCPPGQSTSTNPIPGSVWTYCGPTIGALWGPSGASSAIPDVRSLGVKCDGVTNDTAALQYIISTYKLAVLPANATCLANLALSGDNFLLAGLGHSSILKPFGAGNAISVTNSNFGQITDLTVQDGGFGSGTGISLGTNTNNLKISHVKVDGFPTYNIACIGATGAQLSGNSILDSYVLAPATQTANIYWNWCNDFHMVDNQVGTTSSLGLGRTSGNGIFLEHAQAGKVIGNFVWQQNIALFNDNSAHNDINDNRFTTSSLQGIYVANSTYTNIADNKVYANSQATFGAVEAIKFVNSSAGSVVGNNCYDWSEVNSVAYCVGIDATSFQLSLIGNRWAFYTGAPTYIDPAALPFIILQGNVPLATAWSNIAPITAFAGSTPLIGVGGTTSLVYLGSVSGTNQNAAGVPLGGVVGGGLLSCISVHISVAPATGETFSFQMQITGADKPLTLTIPAGQFRNNICLQDNAMRFAATDYANIKWTTNGASNLGSIQARWSFSAYQ